MAHPSPIHHHNNNAAIPRSEELLFNNLGVDIGNGWVDYAGWYGGFVSRMDIV